MTRSLDEIRAALAQLPDGITEADVASVGVTREEWDAVAAADLDEHFEQERAARESVIAETARWLDPAEARAILDEESAEREHAAGCNMSVENCADCSAVERRGWGEVEAREISLAAAHRVIAAEQAAGSPRHPAIAAAAAMQPPSTSPGSTTDRGAASPRQAGMTAMPPLRLDTGAAPTHRPPASRR